MQDFLSANELKTFSATACYIFTAQSNSQTAKMSVEILDMWNKNIKNQ